MTARALPRKVENRKKVQINSALLLAYHRCIAVVRTAVLLCCRCGLVGTYCSTAVVLLWWWVGVESMILAFKSKVLRSLFARTRYAVEIYAESYVESSVELRCNVDLSMLRLSRCPGILPDYGHCSVMIKW